MASGTAVPRATRTTSTPGLWAHLCERDRGPQYRYGTHRSVPPRETLRRIRPLLHLAGITRLADLTGLDWIGIPVCQAIHPNGRLFSVAQGKGLTHLQARVSALMESLEQFHLANIATNGSLTTVTETVGTMRRQLAYDPYALALSEPSYLNDAMPIAWLPATDLSHGAATWVPLALCDVNSCVEERLYLPLFRTSTNGLASGNTVAEALVHALCEVVERDSVWRRVEAGRFSTHTVILESITSRLVRRILNQFERAGLTTLVADSSGPTGIPCFEVWVDHPDGPGLAWGSGCHPRRATALLRALTEAAQTRATFIAGSRDDLRRSAYRQGEIDRTLRAFDPDRPRTRRFADSPSLAVQDLPSAVRDIVGRTRSLTGMSPMAVDLSRPEFGLPVVYVVAPGLKDKLR